MASIMDYKLLLENCKKPTGEVGLKVIKDMNKNHETLARWAITYLDINPDNIIVDVGCGGGINVERFSNLSEGLIYGVDYSEKSVEESIKHNQEKIDKGQVKIIQAEVSKLPFKSETFDLVTGFETTYFWPDMINDFKEIYRVLKHGAKVLIANAERDDARIINDYGSEILKSIKMHAYSEEEFLYILTEAGFTNIKIFTEKTCICVIGEKS